MRRMVIAVLVVAPLVVAAGMTPAHADGMRQRASALWLRERGAKATIFIVFAAHRVDASGASTIAGVGRIPCRVERGPTYKNMICNGRLTVDELPRDDFFFHPGLERAELTTRIGGRSTHVRWTGGGDRPGVAPSLPAPEHPRLWIEMERRARAGGRVLGARVRPRTKLHRAELLQSVRLRPDLPGRAGRHLVSFEIAMPPPRAGARPQAHRAF